MPSITTVLSPAVFEATVTGIENKTVIIIDILRATTTMVVAFENGAKSILPVDEVSKAANAGSAFIKAGERNGEKVDGFDLGNSPKEFTKEVVLEKDIVMTTTNGTKAIAMCENAKTIYIASYRNILATLNKVIGAQEDVLLFCSGWKDQVNLEDTLFAGEMAHHLIQAGFDCENDSTELALSFYEKSKNNEQEALKNASHVQRFKNLGVDDLEECLKRDTFDRVLVVDSGVCYKS